MKIGIDARFVGPQGTGLGKYTEKLIDNLQEIDSKNTYAIFLKKDNWHFLKLKNKKFSKVLADVNWYAVKEQIKMPPIYSGQKLDLLHVPHFNVPVMYNGKFIVTIHDLIHHEFSQESTTTQNYLMFKLKRLGYKFVINRAIKKSTKIITPSNFVKEEIVKNFKVSPSKINVTYEAAEEEYFIDQRPETRFAREARRAINHQPFLLYVGNVYPHKNLNRLLDALKILNTKYPILNTHLILVCPRDIFWGRLKDGIEKRQLEDSVGLKDYQTAKDLNKLFHKAQAYVSPSLAEGFGIPGLNAMAAGLPVICSNIPTFREIYGEAACYFDPKNPKDIADKIKDVLMSERIKTELVKKGIKQAQKYSWLKMAKETLSIYESEFR